MTPSTSLPNFDYFCRNYCFFGVKFLKDKGLFSFLFWYSSDQWFSGKFLEQDFHKIENKIFFLGKSILEFLVKILESQKWKKIKYQTSYFNQRVQFWQISPKHMMNFLAFQHKLVIWVFIRLLLTKYPTRLKINSNNYYTKFKKNSSW